MATLNGHDKRKDLMQLDGQLDMGTKHEHLKLMLKDKNCEGFRDNRSQMTNPHSNKR